MLRAYAVNSVAPVLLMGLVVRHVAESTAVRIVNVSTAAARTAYPGLGTYGMTKAALRLAGMVMAEELQLGAHPATAETFHPFLRARSSGHADAARGPQRFAIRLPIVDVFKGFKANGELVAPDSLPGTSCPASRRTAIRHSVRASIRSALMPDTVNECGM